MNITKSPKFWKKNDLKKAVEEQLDKNIEVVKSLRDYDQGKKTISTTEIRRHLPDIQVAP